MKLRLFALWLASACASHHEPEATEMPSTLASSQNPTAGVDDTALAKLLADHWDGLMQRSPVWATTLGDHRFDDRLGDNSRAGVAESHAWRDRLLERARALPTAGLTARDRHVDRQRDRQPPRRDGEWSRRDARERAPHERAVRPVTRGVGGPVAAPRSVEADAPRLERRGPAAVRGGSQRRGEGRRRARLRALPRRAA